MRAYTGLTVRRGLYRVIPDGIQGTVLHAIGADADFDPNVRNNIQRLVDDVTARVTDVDLFALAFGRPNIILWPSQPSARQGVRTGCSSST
ncbi:hypothetical protein [Streptomyces phaeochromogenes]